MINIGGLAMGMAVAILIGLWIQDELTFNKYHSNYETIAKVYRNNNWGGRIETGTSAASGLGTLLRSEYGMHFRNVTMIRQRVEDRVLSYGEKKMTQGGYFMQPEGVEMFGLKMIRGGGGKHLSGMNTILLSESLSKKLFADKDPIDQTVVMDAKWDMTVTGVYEDLPKNSDFYGVAYFAPLELYVGGPENLDVWDNYNMTVYVQLHDKNDLPKASSAIKDAMLPHVDQETLETKPQLFLHPMRDWHLSSQFENGHAVTSKAKKMLWSFTIIGVFVLILACINFMNLSTARSEKRAREVGIRKSIGSLRSQLVQQFFGESLLVAALSFAAAIVFTQLSLPWFNEVSDKKLFIPWSSVSFWAAGISFAIVTGLLAGSYPALYLSSFNRVKVLKVDFKAGRSASLPRSVLVTLQFTVYISLIV